jgi:hypothetical protein
MEVLIYLEAQRTLSGFLFIPPVDLIIYYKRINETFLFLSAFGRPFAVTLLQKRSGGSERIMLS